MVVLLALPVLPGLLCVLSLLTLLVIIFAGRVVLPCSADGPVCGVH